MFRALICAVTVLLCAPLAAPALTTSSRQQEAARAGYARLVDPVSTVTKTVPFDLSGYVSLRGVKRAVVLEKQGARGTWLAVARARTDRDGRFTFRGVRLTSSSRLRGRLPALRTRPEITTETLFVRANRQQGRLYEMPGVNQQGPVAAAPRNDTVVAAQFDPPVPGRRVLLESFVEGVWVRFEARRADASGSAIFNVPAHGTYRAIAKRFQGVDEVRTTRARTRERALMFEDTFDAPTLDPRWVDFAVRRGYPGSPRTCALSHSSQRSVGDGVLRLGIGLDPTKLDQECVYPTADGTGSAPYLYQSQLSTLRSFRFTHGIVAARMKFAPARGRHTAFWIQTDSKVPGEPDKGAEIDVVEFFGAIEGTEHIGAFIHHLGPNGHGVKYGELFQNMADMKPPGDTWWDSFHVFSVAWTPTEYVFRVDGHEFFREDRGVSLAPQWLVLSAQASDYELPYITPENIDQESFVDWVRVWRL